VEKYHYTECGLDNIYLVNGYEVMEFEGESIYAVHDTEGLHRAIGEDILNKTTLLSGKEIRFLRKEIELSQKDIANILGKTDQTVANWEKSVSIQAQSDDIIIRMRYASSIGLTKELADYLERLALDEMNRLEIEFSEEKGHWEPAILIAA